MTSVIPMEKNGKEIKMKCIHSKEEVRSFLNLSQENIAQPDAKTKFNLRFIPSRNTILSSSAVMIAILCLSLEGWTLQCSLTNVRELQQLKRNVESLKEQFIQSEKQNAINQLKTLEKLYSNLWKEDIDYDYNYDDDDDDDVDEDDNDDNDDDDETSSSYYPDLYPSPTDTSKSSDLFENTITSTPGLVDSSTQLTTMLKAQTTSKEEEFKKNTDSIKEEHRTHFDQKEIDNQNNTEHKRDVFAEDNANTKHNKKNSKAKRFVTDRAIIDNSSVDTIKHQRFYNGQHQPNMTSFKMNLKANDKSDSAVNTFENSTLYIKETDNLTEKSDEQNSHLENKTMRNNHQKYRRSSTKNSKKLGRKLIRRNLRIPRQVRAIHYGADSTLFSVNDEHTGNGRARHNSGVFKAWRPSDWVTDLGMDRFFMFNDGKLTVHESGLYLVYAQIHYLDEHDENGFHLLVNDKPVLQCMIFSPGTGHKSRSCFSAQVIVLQSGDYLILKEVGSARYTLFQHDKSFFGLVKLGEVRKRQVTQENKTL